MKKMILILAMISGGMVANAQITLSVPKVVEEKFDQLYPKATMTHWEKEGNNYEADFKDGDDKMEAVFSPDGTFIQKELHIEVTALPAAATKYMESTYPGKKVSEALKITKANGTVYYEAEAADLEVTFDAVGGYVSTKKE